MIYLIGMGRRQGYGSTDDRTWLALLAGPGVD